MAKLRQLQRARRDGAVRQPRRRRVKRLCEHVIVLQDGEVVNAGRPARRWPTGIWPCRRSTSTSTRLRRDAGSAASEAERRGRPGRGGGGRGGGRRRPPSERPGPVAAKPTSTSPSSSIPPRRRQRPHPLRVPRRRGATGRARHARRHAPGRHRRRVPFRSNPAHRRRLHARSAGNGRRRHQHVAGAVRFAGGPQGTAALQLRDADRPAAGLLQSFAGGGIPPGRAAVDGLDRNASSSAWSTTTRNGRCSGSTCRTRARSR